jgi:hypothetical protein
VKVVWKAETHYVLLDPADRQIDADGLRVKASAAILKSKGEDFSLTLPLGGTASYRGQVVAGPGPRGIEMVEGRGREQAGKNLIRY